MKTLRWILSFPLSLFAAWSFIFAAESGLNTLSWYHPHSLTIKLLESFLIAMPAFAFWVFLTCLIVPTNKRLGAIITLILGLILLVGEFSLIPSTYKLSGKDELWDTLSIIFATFFGLIIGYAISYIVFKDRKWRQDGNEKHKKDLAEVYQQQITNL